MKHQCPVCGWPGLNEPPRSVDGAPSFEICPCCGFQFGFDDDDQGISYLEWRARWVAAGLRWWSSRQTPPAGWNPKTQIASLQDS